MSSELARLVAAAGTAYSAPFRHLTRNSVFVAGRVPMHVGQSVKAFLLGHSVKATVVFVPVDPPGVVLTFEPDPEFAALIASRATSSHDSPWNDEDVTGTHDPKEAARYAAMAADRAEKAFAQRKSGEETVDVDPEDPTNPGARAMVGSEYDVTPSAVPTVLDACDTHVPDDPRAQRGLMQPAASQDLSSARGTRLRATTQVNGPTPPDWDSGEPD